MLITMDRLVAEHGVRPKAILHVGAHLAEEAPAYAEAGVGSVLWVEANPHLMERLVGAIAPYVGQECVLAAVSDTDGAEAHLHMATFSMSSSLLPPKEHLRYYPHIRYPETLPVETVTVDTLLQRLRKPAGVFDMLNIDIEGAELLAFAGMPETLKHLRWIYLEVNYEEMYAGCALLPQVDAFLGDRGFVRVALEDAIYEGKGCGWGDALYQRNDTSLVNTVSLPYDNRGSDGAA